MLPSKTSKSIIRAVVEVNGSLWYSSDAVVIPRLGGVRSWLRVKATTLLPIAARPVVFVSVATLTKARLFWISPPGETAALTSRRSEPGGAVRLLLRVSRPERKSSIDR